MTGNLMPWLILFAVVVASLVWKGYVKLPGFSTLSPAIQGEVKAAADAVMPVVVRAAENVVPAPAAALLDQLAGLDSHTLGVAFATAKRREAETELAHAIAKQAGDTIKATFSAPFTPPSGDASPAAPAPVGGQ